MPSLVEDFRFILGENGKFQAMVREVLPVASESQRRMLLDLAGVVEKQLKDVEPQVAQLQSLFESEIKAMQTAIENDQKTLAELEAQLEAAKKKLAEPRPEPVVPPEPPLPGFGDPAYGRRLSDELLDLIGLGTASIPAAKGDAGEVWELTSADWRIEAPKGQPQPPAAPPPSAEKAPPARPTPLKQPSDEAWDMKSTDWAPDNPDP